MKQLTALIWKEWHEVRILFAIAVFVFLGLPIIGGIQFVIFQNGRFSVDVSPWVFFLGGLFAIVVGIGIVTRDVNGKLEEFWRSRPVSVGRWLLVKYALGLCVVLVSLILPMCIERFFDRNVNVGRAPQILAWHPFLWIALFSISFAIACIVRRGAHAGMLSVAIALLIYFLPTIIPPLGFLSLTVVSLDSQAGGNGWYGSGGLQGTRIGYVPWAGEFAHYGMLQVKFVLSMLVIAGLGIVVAILALRRDWRIEAGRKMLYWSVGAAMLLLFSTAAFQVAANLTLLDTGWVPAIPNAARETSNYFQRTEFALASSKRGVLVSRSQRDRSVFLVRGFAISNNRVDFDEPFELQPNGPFAWNSSSATPLWDPARPDVLYIPDEAVVLDSDRKTVLPYPTLTTMGLRSTERTFRTQAFTELAAPMTPNYGTRAIIWNQSLWVWGRHVCVFDLADPYRPKLIQSFPSLPWAGLQLIGADKVEATLPQLPGLPARQRLELLASPWDERSRSNLDGDILLRSVDGPTSARLLSYKLTSLSDTKATFAQFGVYEGSFIDSWFAGRSMRQAASAGTLFHSYYGRVGGLHLTAMDLTSPQMAPIGHFAFGEDSNLHLLPLPDGRMLAIGLNKYFLLAAPNRGR